MTEFLFAELESDQQSKQATRKLQERRQAKPNAPLVPTAEQRKSAADTLLDLLQTDGRVSAGQLDQLFPKGAYTKRISDLRKRGFVIDCEAGDTMNWFVLRGEK